MQVLLKRQIVINIKQISIVKVFIIFKNLELIFRAPVLRREVSKGKFEDIERYYFVYKNMM